MTQPLLDKTQLELQTITSKQAHQQRGPLSSDFLISKKELVNCMTALTKERKYDEELNLLEKIATNPGFEAGLQTNFKIGIDGSQEDLLNRDNAFGNNEKTTISIKTYRVLLMEALEDVTFRILILCSLVQIIASYVNSSDGIYSTSHLEGATIMLGVIVCSCVAAYIDLQKEKQFFALNQAADSKREFSVIRKGALKILTQSQMMVGDVVVITEGMMVPADGLLFEGHEVTTDESAVTGEKIQMKKSPLAVCVKLRNEFDTTNDKRARQDKVKPNARTIPTPLLLAGSTILSGEGMFVVIVVGESSCEGQLANSISKEEAQPTPLQEKLENIANGIGKFGLYSSILIFLVLLARFIVERALNHWTFSTNNLNEILRYFILAVSVLVVAVPEGLPLSVTLSLAYSLKSMLNDKNQIQRIQACETMGMVDVLCTDKTGILTKNKMNLITIWNQEMIKINLYDQYIYLGNSVPTPYQDMFQLNCAVNSTATLKPEEKGSKTEIACLHYLDRCQIDYLMLRNKYQYYVRFPFTSTRKRMSTILETGQGKGRLYIKGASEALLQSSSHICLFNDAEVNPRPIDAKMHQTIKVAIEQLAGQALRTIVFAYKDVDLLNDDLTSQDEKGVKKIEESGLILYAILGIKDEMRQEVPLAVQDCLQAGISVTMLTGDNRITARAVAVACGIIKASKQTDKDKIRDTDQAQDQAQQSQIMDGAEFIARVGGIVCFNCKMDKQCKCPLTETQRFKMVKGLNMKDVKIRIDVVKNISEFKAIYNNIRVLADIQPRDKYTFVTGLRQCGRTVAVTGDGTSDAFSLKKGNVGLSIFSGTDCAKEASDIVLLDDSFNSIVSAVIWGRNLFDSIKKFLQFQVTVIVSAVLVTLAGTAVSKQEPLTAIQLLWVYLLMDSLAGVALATESPTRDVLARPPFKKDEYVISKLMYKHILGQTIFQFIVIMLLIFLGHYILPEYTDDFDEELTRVWNARSQFRDPYKYYDNNIYIDMQNKDQKTSAFSEYAQRGFFAMKYSNPGIATENVTFVRSVLIPNNLPHAVPQYVQTFTTVYIYDTPGTRVRNGMKKTLLEHQYGFGDVLYQWKGQNYEFNIQILGPSRHYTYLFNAFVWMQIFNFINSRKLQDEANVFSGITANRLFLEIIGGIALMQILITRFGGRAFECYYRAGGLTFYQFIICVAIGFLSFIWSIMLKSCCACNCLTKQPTDPIEPAKSINIKKTFIRKLQRQNPMMNKLQLAK